MIVGLGTDIIEVPRIARAFDRFGERFLRKVYTPEEIAYCLRATHRGRVVERLAGRFAAKEAVMKSLGCGPGKVPWRSVAILPQKGGPPQVVLSGPAARRAAELGVERLLVSISHQSQWAVATAIAESR
ncbi:MAG: holo-ACP synthase [Limnochordales bacterium]|nr:holo-ACP synthase [Limnochordales bacterium]